MLMCTSHKGSLRYLDSIGKDHDAEVHEWKKDHKTHDGSITGMPNPSLVLPCLDNHAIDDSCLGMSYITPHAVNTN